MRRFLLLFVLPASLIACDSKPAPPRVTPPTSTPTTDGPDAPAADAKPYSGRNKGEDGSISGRVAFTGDLPNIPGPTPTTECSAHAEQLVSELVVRDAEGGLQNVFVYVKRGDIKNWSFDVPKEPIVIDQRGCRYYPHVQGMVAGQSMKIKNSDAFMHNVHSLAKENPMWSFAQPNIQEDVLTLQTTFKTFDRQEVVVPLKCDVHAWMNCWVGVLPHSLFTVTGPDGSFKIEGVPPGEYTVEAWHE